MQIRFEDIPEAVVPHARGGEKEFRKRAFTTDDNTVMLGRLIPGASLGVHTHEDESETMYILSGTGRMYYDGAYETLTAGQAHHCPKGHTHGLENAGEDDLVFFAVLPKQ